MSYRNTLKIIISICIVFMLPVVVVSKTINSTIYIVDTNKTKIPNYRLEDISIAKSLGVWEDKKDYGFFTVLVYRYNGIETTRVIIKKSFFTSDAKTEDFKIIKDIYIPTPYQKGTIQDIHLHMINSKLLITLDILMSSMDGAVMREVLLVDIQGKVSMIQEAKYVDAIGEI